jgi:hypothetical protein
MDMSGKPRSAIPATIFVPALLTLPIGPQGSLVRRPRARARFDERGQSYTATVTKKRDRDRDIVRELQEDAKWSMWTNTFGRQRGWGRPRSVPHSVGLRTYMLAAIIILGTGCRDRAHRSTSQPRLTPGPLHPGTLAEHGDYTVSAP